jgi:hypothetical protein
MNLKVRLVDFLYGIHASDAIHLLERIRSHHSKLCEIFEKLSRDNRLDTQIDSEFQILIRKLSEDFYLLKESIETAPHFHQVGDSGLCQPLR